MFKIFRFIKKFGFSNVFAFVALILSVFAIFQSYLAREDSRLISGLNLRPIVHLNATMPKDKNSSSYFTVLNVGPTDAVQLEIQMVIHTYSPASKTIDGSISATWHRWVVPKLSPLTHESFELPADELIQRIKLFKNPENFVLELQMTYRRTPDMAKYMYSSLYFVNPDGRWVNEEDRSLKAELYDPIKQAISRVLNREERPIWNLSDKLHSQKPSFP